MSIRKHRFKNRELILQLDSEADLSVFSEIFQDLDYRLLEQIIEKAQHPILDIGAHIGLFSLYASCINNNIQILAFEPDPDNFQLLKKHLHQNHCSNIKAKNIAVSDQIATVDFYRSPDSHNHSLYLDGEAIKLPSSTLEKIIQHYERIDLAKIDCEGAEFPIILHSSDQTLSKIQNFYIEYHQFKPEFDPQKIVKRLQSIGYKTQIQRSKYDDRMGFIFAKKM